MGVSVSIKERTREEVDALARVAAQKLQEVERVTQALFLKTKATHEKLYRNHLCGLVDEERFCRQSASISGTPVSRLTRKRATEDSSITWISEIDAQNEQLSNAVFFKPPPDVKFVEKFMSFSLMDRAEHLENIINRVDQALAIGEKALERLENTRQNSEAQLFLRQVERRTEIKKAEQAEKKASLFKILAMVSWFFSTFFGATLIANCTSLVLDNFQNRAFPRERFLNVFLKNLFPSTKAAAIPVIIGTIGYVFLENPSLQRRTIDVFRYALQKLLTNPSPEEKQREDNLTYQGVSSDPPNQEGRKGHQNNTSKLLFGSVAVLAMALVRKSA